MKEKGKKRQKEQEIRGIFQSPTMWKRNIAIIAQEGWKKESLAEDLKEETLGIFNTNGNHQEFFFQTPN